METVSGASPVPFPRTVAGVFKALRGGKAWSPGMERGGLSKRLKDRRPGSRAGHPRGVGRGHIPPPRGARRTRSPQLLQRGRGEQHSFLISARGQAARPRSRRSRWAGDLRRPRSRSGGGSATGVKLGTAPRAPAAEVRPQPREGAATCRSEGRRPTRLGAGLGSCCFPGSASPRSGLTVKSSPGESRPHSSFFFLFLFFFSF